MSISRHSRLHWMRAADEYRDALSRNHLTEMYMPALYSSLGSVKGKRLLDAGCGDGRYSRELAEEGASVVAIDGAASFVEIAKRESRHSRVEFEYADLTRNLRFRSGEFDVVFSNMVLMDLPKIDRAIREFSRVLKPRGKLVFSIVHPCFFPFDWKCRGDRKLYKMVDDYFTPRTVTLNYWRKTLHFHRPLSAYAGALQKNDLSIVSIAEPRPRPAQLKRHPEWEHHTRIPSFLIVSAIKAAGAFRRRKPK
jgi:2-polyprenyl-3-methyl-5-hydroxy-6-metoxy-1,4-benzoquinol methylase